MDRYGELCVYALRDQTVRKSHLASNESDIFSKTDCF